MKNNTVLDDINNFDELMTLFLVGVYNPLVNYSAKFSKKMDHELFTKQGRKVTNFVIIRKTGMDS